MFILLVGLTLPLLATAALASLRHVKVPVVLGVMSRCPDAILCESLFDAVITDVHDKIDLTLSFIAKQNASDPEFGVTCMHGRDECAGNVQELCAAAHLPLRQWWAYIQCQNAHGRALIGTPPVARGCAQRVGFDWGASGVGRCAGLDGRGVGVKGVARLRESVAASVALGITKSCTMMISGRQVCVHDGTWKDCPAGHEPADFIKQINDEYEKLNRGSGFVEQM